MALKRITIQIAEYDYRRVERIAEETGIPVRGLILRAIRALAMTRPYQPTKPADPGLELRVLARRMKAVVDRLVNATDQPATKSPPPITKKRKQSKRR